MKYLIVIVAAVILSWTVPELDCINIPTMIEEAEAEQKTYYDYNTDGFKSVDTDTGQAFDYNTGEYSTDYSYK